MEKRFISKEKKVKFVMMERKVFSKVSHERIVKLSFSFQDKNYLYMVMELCRGGELLDVIVYVCYIHIYISIAPWNDHSTLPSKRVFTFEKMHYALSIYIYIYDLSMIYTRDTRSGKIILILDIILDMAALRCIVTYIYMTFVLDIENIWYVWHAGS